MRAGGAGSSNISDGIFEVYPNWAQQIAVPATMKAGDCSFHSGLLAHAAGANMTPGRRRAMTCAYMPDGKYPPSIPGYGSAGRCSPPRPAPPSPLRSLDSPLLVNVLSERVLSGCPWNGVQNVLPKSYVEQLSVGDPLDNDWLNPLIYHSDPSRRLSAEAIGDVYPPWAHPQASKL